MQLIILCGQSQSSQNDDLTKVLIPILAALMSAAVTYFIAFYNNKKALGKSIDEQLDNILKIAVQYPYLEMEDFTNAWTRNKINSSNAVEAEKYQRYEIYTTIVFNYMERYCEFHEYIPNSMKKVDIESWIINHKEIWNNPVGENDNKNGYPEKFRCLIDNYLK